VLVIALANEVLEQEIRRERDTRHIRCEEGESDRFRMATGCKMGSRPVDTPKSMR
jgi:hypothetical protein